VRVVSEHERIFFSLSPTPMQLHQTKHRSAVIQAKQLHPFRQRPISLKYYGPVPTWCKRQC